MAAPADRRLRTVQREEAARLGYHPDIGPRPTAPDLADDELRVFYGYRGADPASGERAVYKGKEVPANGCLGRSVAQLKKYDHPDAAQIARRISTQSYEDALTEPSVRGIRQSSACMRRSGFRYASPLEPLNHQAFQGEEISAKEKETAAADVRCKEETGLLDIWFKAESTLQKADIEKNSAVLKELRTAHHKRVKAARRIVAEG